MAAQRPGGGATGLPKRTSAPNRKERPAMLDVTAKLPLKDPDLFRQANPGRIGA